LNFHRQQWIFNVSSLLVAAFESCRNRQVPPSITVNMFALQPLAVSAGRSGSVKFFGIVSHLYCRQRFLALLSAGQLLITDHTVSHSNAFCGISRDNFSLRRCRLCQCIRCSFILFILCKSFLVLVLRHPLVLWIQNSI